jgi:Holliday junction resolvase RusA-like endonuclease
VNAPLTFTVPLVPPSVNDYVRHIPRGGRVIHYVTAEGQAYKKAVAIFARGQEVTAKHYELEVTVYLGKGERGDGDNFWKCIADGLKECRVIHSDAAVLRWVLEVDRDPDNPRTVITVRPFSREKK